MSAIRLRIPDMHCVGCTIAVEGALEDVEGVKSARANYARGVADVEYDDQRVTHADLLAAVELAGYSATPLDGSQ